MSSKSSTPAVDFSNTLCLACSSSLPTSKSSQIFTTNCCSKPICTACLTSNPRLARYDPCLACLGGVGAIFAGSSKGKQLSIKNINVDGAMRDEDTFVLGDDDDEYDEGGEELNESTDPNAPRSPPPPYSSAPSIVEPGSPAPTQESPIRTEGEAGPSTEAPTPSKYYIKPNDNLQGIALRHNVNGRELCRLNNLPPSTLSTTPHILHTRAFLLLPPSARSMSKPSPDDVSTTQEAGREARLARERAEKRLQTLTKEVDWRVAKAYVALADVPDVNAGMKGKESALREGSGRSGNRGVEADFTLEGRAVDQYLDDEEWEERERREGRTASIQPFPYFTVGKYATLEGKRRLFWPWKS